MTKSPPLNAALGVSRCNASNSIVMPRGGRPLVMANRIWASCRSLLADGSITCWGQNMRGQLGDGTMTTPTLVPVAGPVGPYAEISAGDHHTCARAGGRIDCWGSNIFGELGDATQTQRPVAAPVSTITDAIQIAGMAHSACALRATGTVMCWGDNVNGELGIGMSGKTSVPVAVRDLDEVIEISARTSGHVCARKRDASVWCWGNNDSGQIGNGTLGADAFVPVRVVGLP